MGSNQIKSQSKWTFYLGTKPWVSSIYVKLGMVKKCIHLCMNSLNALFFHLKGNIHWKNLFFFCAVKNAKLTKTFNHFRLINFTLRLQEWLKKWEISSWIWIFCWIEIYSKKLSWAELIYHRDFLLFEKLIWDCTVSPRFPIGWKNRHPLFDWLKLWIVNSLFKSLIKYFSLSSFNDFIYKKDKNWAALYLSSNKKIC